MWFGLGVGADGLLFFSVRFHPSFVLRSFPRLCLVIIDITCPAHPLNAHAPSLHPRHSPHRPPPHQSNLYPTYTSLPRALTTLIRTEGVRGLFQGFTATAARDAPYAGIYVVLYEEMKEVLGESFGVLDGVGGKMGDLVLSRPQ